MASAATARNEMDSQAVSTPVFRPSSHRSTVSFSSFSSSSSTSSTSSSFTNHDEYYYLSSPKTPLRFSGVPFSWEQLPGIPKQQTPNKKESCHQSDLLPLPPAAAAANSSSSFKKYSGEISPKKSTSGESFRKDPFFTALVECSKDDDDDHHHRDHDGYWKGSKVTRTLSNRIGFINMYTSCKRTCAVSESIVNLPRSRAYDLLGRRSS